jgi:hypothetical protein
VQTTYVDERSGWENGDLLVAFLVFILVAGIGFFVFFSPMLRAPASSTPAHRPPGVDFAAQSASIIAARDLCQGQRAPIVIRTYLIAQDPRAMVPDVVDAHYSCGLGGPERAFLWSPGER